LSGVRLSTPVCLSNAMSSKSDSRAAVQDQHCDSLIAEKQTCFYNQMQASG
jgi:hypothetical protein